LEEIEANGLQLIALSNRRWTLQENMGHGTTFHGFAAKKSHYEKSSTKDFLEAITCQGTAWMTFLPIPVSRSGKFCHPRFDSQLGPAHENHPMTNDSCPIRFVILGWTKKPADQTTPRMVRHSSVVREGNTAAYRSGLGALGSYPWVSVAAGKGKKKRNAVWQQQISCLVFVGGIEAEDASKAIVMATQSSTEAGR
jgi:hypothetical protein